MGTMGDCAAVIASCAGRGRLRDPRAIPVLRAALGAAAAKAFRTQRGCISRADNVTADALAKAARKTGHPSASKKQPREGQTDT